MSSNQVKAIELTKFGPEGKNQVPDLLALEEPLEIRLGFGPLEERNEEVFTVTMRTPGADNELGLGLLYSEGVIQGMDDVLSVKYCTDRTTGELSPNIIRVEIHPDKVVDLGSGRKQFMNSSCGICGKGSIEELKCISPYSMAAEIPVVTSDVLISLITSQRAQQGVFEHTGGLHAVSLFDADGKMIRSREDIGRHNALDKIIGATLLEGQLPINNHILMFSGRASYEMIQKAIMSGCSVVAAIGAPSSLAVETAQQFDISLIGFLKNDRFNVYSGSQRIDFS
jgi:FdhD protein